MVPLTTAASINDRQQDLEEDVHWNLFPRLTTITDGIFAPVTSQGLAPYLAAPDYDFLELIRVVYRQVNNPKTAL